MNVNKGPEQGEQIDSAGKGYGQDPLNLSIN